MMANRRIRSVLYFLLDWFLVTFVEKVQPKGQHTKLRFYHVQPLWTTDTDYVTVIPNRQVRRIQTLPPVSFIVQMVEPKAPAKRSNPRKVQYNWLIHDLAAGQALLAVPSIDLDNDDTVTVVLPKGLKKGSGRSAYGCNEYSEWDEAGPCNKAPSEAVVWLTMDDSYFVNCPIHAGL